MFLTRAQKMRIIVISILYLFLMGFVKMIVINKKMNINDFLVNALLIFIWLGLSTAITNSISVNYY